MLLIQISSADDIIEHSDRYPRAALSDLFREMSKADTETPEIWSKTSIFHCCTHRQRPKLLECGCVVAHTTIQLPTVGQTRSRGIGAHCVERLIWIQKSGELGPRGRCRQCGRSSRPRRANVHVALLHDTLHENGGGGDRK